ncbi:MAG: hypothetical protein CSB44_07985 [Gammaproteobacteria bacterium]|nr:MAG: hypothetical protein CSB44_07985 [Gammaproteobacteria bacterium]
MSGCALLKRGGPGGERPGRIMPVMALATTLLAVPSGAVSAAGPFSDQLAAPSGINGLFIHTSGSGDTVDYAPNIGGGEHAPAERRQRYTETGAGIVWSPLAPLELSLSFARRHLNGMRDAYELDAWSGELRTRLTPEDSRTHAHLAIGLATNKSDRLVKNSWTRINGARLTEVSLQDARDRTLHADLTTTTPLTRNITASGLIGIGRVAVEHAALTGSGSDARGCEYDFSFTGTSGLLKQPRPCGNILAFEQTYASEAAIDDRFGLAPSKDIAWQGDYWRIGAGASLAQGRFDANVGVRWRYWQENDLMAAIRERGNGPITISRTAWLGMGWRLSPSLRIGAAAVWRSAPLLNEAPVLYNALSVNRYHGEAMTFTLGVQLSL